MAKTKPQFVEHIPRSVKGRVGELLKKNDQRGVYGQIIKDLDLEHLQDRDVEALSGGELQRFAIAATCVQAADVYMFDEPSSYLDVKQRLTAARVIRSLLAHDKYVIAVEHDLSVLDYLSDFICVLYGVASVYGVVSMPFGVREGINIFLDGVLPTENLRFREDSLTFKMVETAEDRPDADIFRRFDYPSMRKTFLDKQVVGTEKETASSAVPSTTTSTPAAGGFKLSIEEGQFTNSEIIVLLGENGTGKTTFIRMLAGHERPDGNVEIPELNVSYKPQKLVSRNECSVRDLFLNKIRDMFVNPQFKTDVLDPLRINDILDNQVNQLSGGELQRVAITLALGKPADIYLIDEPSAYLDSEQRVIASKVIKRFILHAKKTAFIVEHDFIMATYLADRVVVFEGTPGKDAHATKPQSLVSGMNRFLSALQITFRRDPQNFRPRINKTDSVKDREQKESGDYFFLER